MNGVTALKSWISLMMSLAFSAEPIKIAKGFLRHNLCCTRENKARRHGLLQSLRQRFTIALFKVAKPALARLAAFPKPRILFDALGKPLFKPLTSFSSASIWRSNFVILAKPLTTTSTSMGALATRKAAPMIQSIDSVCPAFIASSLMSCTSPVNNLRAASSS